MQHQTVNDRAPCGSTNTTLFRLLSNQQAPAEPIFLRLDGECVEEASFNIQYLASLDSAPEDVDEGTDLSVLADAKAIKVGLVSKAMD